MKVKSDNVLTLLFTTLEVMVIAFSFGLVNINSFVRLRQYADVENYSANEWEYVYLCIFNVIAIALLLWRSRSFQNYLIGWKSNKPLIAFLAFSVASLTWTVYLPATFNKLIFLFFSTIVGSYVAVRYKIRGAINLITWIGGICSIASMLIILFLPFGIMRNEPFIGSWVGMFWHRNHTGNIFAFFNMVFLIRFFMDGGLTKKQRGILPFLYLLSAVIVFGSRSATGIIVLLFLNSVVVLTIIWLKRHYLLKSWHYYGSAALLLVGFLVFVTNTRFYFGLLGRSQNMTGRVPLWQDLFFNIYLKKPFLGYGFGALWMQESFRALMQSRHGWRYPVYFADNGFFDVLLSTGILGFTLFLIVYISLGVRSFRQAITVRTWTYFFPFITFLYVFIGNLTYSFLLEVDQFVWMILVMMVFVTTEEQESLASRNTSVSSLVWS